MQRSLEDGDWQRRASHRLHSDSGRLRELLGRGGFSVLGGSPLFQTIRAGQARALADNVARNGLLVRYFEQPGMLRFGLPGCSSDWEQLEKVINLLLQAKSKAAAQ